MIPGPGFKIIYMREIKTFISLLLLLSVSSKAFSQTAAEKLDYLVNNIRVYVLHQPNTDNPSYYQVKTTGIRLDTDSIILGKKHNNGMGQSAILLSALFKDGSKKVAFGGDQKLQDLAYLLLHPLQKPVEIFFINDVLAPFDGKYASQYGFYVGEYEGTALIYDGAFKGKDASTAGRIIIGGSRTEGADLARNEGFLLYGFAKLYMQHYSYLDGVSIGISPNKTPPPSMYNKAPLYIMRGQDDLHNGILDAIAFSFRFTFDGETPGRFKSEFYDWLSNGPYVVTPTAFVSYKMSGFDVPAHKMLHHEIRKSFHEMVDTGRILTNPPFSYEENVLKHFKIYGLNFLPDRLRLTNKAVLAAYCDLFVKQKGIDLFLKSLVLQDNRLQKATDEKQFGVFIENLCQVIQGDRSFTEARNAKEFSMGVLYPLALLDLFMDFPSKESLSTNLSVFDETFNGLFPPNSISKILLEEYYKIRPAIYEVVTKANKQGEKAMLSTGYANILAMANAILDYMIVNG